VPTAKYRLFWWYIMAKRVVPLTNTQVKQAKESDKEYTLSDGDGLICTSKTGHLAKRHIAVQS
ncbi:hypothetical protein KW517_22415, partial [Vibrio fluvialis]|nr:hypothetical protein [Vibrio fluvialis]